MNTELLLAALARRPTSRKIKYYFYTCSASVPICNEQLHKMFKRLLPIVPFPMLVWQADRILKAIFPTSYAKDAIKQTYEPSAGDVDIYGDLKEISTPFLKFTSIELTYGSKSLKKMGIPDNAKIVLLMVRDSAYLDKCLQGGNWGYHNCRDADIQNYREAAMYLASKGYWVIRMGKIVHERFNVSHPHILDYANSKWRSDFMDIYLSYRCCFFISTSTGIDSVPIAFRRPGALTNVLFPDMPRWFPHKLFIHKKIINAKSGLEAPYRTVCKLRCENSQLKYADFLQKFNFKIIDNNSDEIFSVIEEMEARYSGVWVEKVEDKLLQKKFWDEVSDEVCIRQAKYMEIKMGAKFLLEQKRLMISPSVVSV